MHCLQGDEPEIQGFPSNQLCALAASLKRELAVVGRPDVWLMYNDGPSSSRFNGHGLCRGLDYFSIDNYRSGPVEATNVENLYAKAIYPTLRPPNNWEPYGQGLWFVPGLFAPCELGVNGTKGPCKGGNLSHSPRDVVAKMQEYWKLAQTYPQIVGINPW